MDSKSVGMLVDFNIDCYALGDRVFDLWTRKLVNDPSIPDRLELLESNSVGGYCEPKNFVKILNHLSASMSECGEDRLLNVAVTNVPCDTETGEPLSGFPAINDGGLKDADDSSLIWGLNSDSLWLVGPNGIACLENGFANMEVVSNPFRQFARAVEIALGRDKVRDVMSAMLEDAAGSPSSSPAP